MLVAAILPLLVILSVVAGAAIGILLVEWVRTSVVTPEQEERARDDAAKRAARRAVNEVIARLR